MIFEKQTQDTGKHYLYTHLRLDTNQIFYVGVGTKYNHNKDYTRAKATGSQRNNIWRGITSRTEHKVIILFESDDYQFIKQKEIELIAKHGQIIKNTGGLCNLTNGGDGWLGRRNYNTIKPVYLYHNTGELYKEFEAYSDATKYLKITKSIVKLSIDKDFLVKGYILKSFKTNKVEPILNIKEKVKKRLSKPVYQYSLKNEFIKGWSSSSEAARVLKISGGHIREMANGSNKRKKVGGFIWKYEKQF
jgi:hypothetical protein